MAPTPVHEKHISLCECYEGDHRGEIVSFYERTEQQIRCSECGNIPPELSPRKIPDGHRIELTITHRLDERITRQYREVFPRTPN